MYAKLMVFCSLFLFNFLLLSDEEQEKTCEVLEKNGTEYKKYIENCGEDGKKCYCSNHAKIIEAEKIRQSAKNKPAVKSTQKKCEIKELSEWKDSDFCWSDEGCYSYGSKVPKECFKKIDKKAYDDKKTELKNTCDPINKVKSLDDFFKLDYSNTLKKVCSKYDEKKKTLCDEFTEKINEKSQKELANNETAVKNLCEDSVVFDKRLDALNSFCVNVDNCNNLKEIQKLAEDEMFSKCNDSETQLQSLQKKEECNKKVQDFKEKMKKIIEMKDFNLKNFNKDLIELEECNDQTINESKKYVTNYIEEKTTQERSIFIEITVPEYKPSGLIKSYTTELGKGKRPEIYVEIYCDECGDNNELKNINSFLLGKATNNEKIEIPKFELKWNPEFKYTFF